MRRDLLLPAAVVLDAIAGDPEWLPHPVRGIGWCIARGEHLLRRPDDSPFAHLIRGTLLTASVVAGTYGIADALLHGARKIDPDLGDAIELMLAWTCLASRNLYDEGAAVLDASEAGDRLSARRRLARIVGRDTAHLSAPEVHRAVIETVAESLADGVVAPFMYLTLGGVPLAMAYKAVNTLDSMIGHRDERHLYFGKAAARLDDVANFAPARLTALALVASAALLPGCDAGAAWRTWQRDGGKHRSPNAGQPESTIAGALHVRLGGRNTYAGEVVETPHLGPEFLAATALAARTAVALIPIVTLIGLAAGIFLQARPASRRKS